MLTARTIETPDKIEEIKIVSKEKCNTIHKIILGHYEEMIVLRRKISKPREKIIGI